MNMPRVRKRVIGKRWVIPAIVAVSMFTLIMIITAVFIAVDDLRYRNYSENVPSLHKLKSL